MNPIDRASPLPIYHQLKALIQEQIRFGLWRPGDRIPTERELCQTYAISRSPVRQALSDLAREGVLLRRPGLGTFVADHASVGTCPEISIQMMCSDPHWSAVLEHVSSVWNAEHPDQRVAFDVNVVPHDAFYDLLSTAVGGGTAPDLAMVDSVWVAGLAKSGFLYALEDLESPWSHSGFGQDLYAVFVVQPDGEMMLRPVEVGLKDFVNAEIASGLEQGEIVSLGVEESTETVVPEQIEPQRMPGMRMFGG